MKTPIALGLFVTVVACGAPQTRLSAPPSSAPAAERLAAYARLKPHAPLEGVSGVQGGVPASVYRTSEQLRLADGRVVERPELLLPLLPDDSEAAHAARRSESKENTADWLSAGGIALLVAGASVAVAPFLVARDDENETVPLEPIYIGAGVFVLSIPVFLVAGAQRRQGDDAKARAFELYEPALRRRLNLCEKDGATTPCP